MSAARRLVLPSSSSSSSSYDTAQPRNVRSSFYKSQAARNTQTSDNVFLDPVGNTQPTTRSVKIVVRKDPTDPAILETPNNALRAQRSSSKFLDVPMREHNLSQTSTQSLRGRMNASTSTHSHQASLESGIVPLPGAIESIPEDAQNLQEIEPLIPKPWHAPGSSMPTPNTNRNHIKATAINLDESTNNPRRQSAPPFQEQRHGASQPAKVAQPAEKPDAGLSSTRPTSSFRNTTHVCQCCGHAHFCREQERHRGHHHHPHHRRGLFSAGSVRHVKKAYQERRLNQEHNAPRILGATQSVPDFRALKERHPPVTTSVHHPYVNFPRRPADQMFEILPKSRRPTNDRIEKNHHFEGSAQMSSPGRNSIQKLGFMNNLSETSVPEENIEEGALSSTSSNRVPSSLAWDTYFERENDSSAGDGFHDTVVDVSNKMAQCRSSTLSPL